MIRKRTVSGYIFDGLNILMLGLLALIMVYPMVYEFFVSISDPAMLTKHRGIMISPLGFSASAYQIVFRNRLLLSGYRNTLFILVVGTVFSVALTAMGAYFLTRKRVLFYKPVMVFLLIKMYFSGGLVPFFLTVRATGLYDSLWALIIPTAISTYNMILLRSYFMSIPESLMESVFIDGGGHFSAVFKIVLPLSLPALAVMTLYYGVGYWNSWFNAKIFLKSESLFPLQLVLHKILIQGEQLDVQSEFVDVHNYEQISDSVKAATVMVSTLPILMFYPFLQKYFVSGLMIGSLKE
ncbi:MAG: carbohydrate ABC transporter permease [Christensenellales bacterium]|jgi:putative aldouronate transport system permease protein